MYHAMKCPPPAARVTLRLAYLYYFVVAELATRHQDRQYGPRETECSRVLAFLAVCSFFFFYKSYPN